MILASSASVVFAEFFVEEGWIDSVDEFPDVFVYCGDGARFVTRLMMAEGITFGSHIFIDPKFLLKDKKGRDVISRSLLAHEIVHVMQYEKAGVFGFLKNYVGHFLAGYLKKGNLNAKNWYAAYLAIPDEVEAREYAAKFIKWSVGRFNSG